MRGGPLIKAAVVGRASTRKSFWHGCGCGTQHMCNCPPTHDADGMYASENQETSFEANNVSRNGCGREDAANPTRIEKSTFLFCYTCACYGILFRCKPQKIKYCRRRKRSCDLTNLRAPRQKASGQSSPGEKARQ
jgi:hypothetical protein